MKINSAAVLLMAAPLRVQAFSKGLFNRFRNSRIPLAMSTMTENALLQQDSLPKFKSIEPSQLTPAVSDLLEKLEKDFSSFESRISDDIVFSLSTLLNL